MEARALPSPAVSTGAGAPATSVDPDLSPTGTLLLELWSRDTDPRPIDGWEPTPIDTGGDRRRRGRGIAALMLASALAVGGWMAAANGSEQDRLVSVTGASAAVVSALADLRPLTADLADGAVDDGSSGGVALADLDGAARHLFETASRLDPAGDHGRVRLATIEAARQALEIEDTVGDALTYDNAFAVIIRRPTLPSIATPAGVTGVALDVAEWVGRVYDATASLPSHPHLTDHRREAVEFGGRLEEWQIAYLDALRSGEIDLAARLVDEVSRRLASLDSELRRDLTRVGADTATAIDRLSGDLTRVTAG